MNQIKDIQGFKIYACENKNEFVVHNTNIKNSFAHSHIKNYKTALWIIELVINRKVPNDISYYLLISLLRLTDSKDERNKRYIENINSLMKSKKKKETILQLTERYKTMKKFLGGFMLAFVGLPMLSNLLDLFASYIEWAKIPATKQVVKTNNELANDDCGCTNAIGFDIPNENINYYDDED